MAASDHINEGQKNLIDESNKFQEGIEGATHFPMIVYHGTSMENAKKIEAEGFKLPEDRGAHGPAIYTATDRLDAASYASPGYVRTVLDREGFEEGAIVEAVLSPRKPIDAHKWVKTGEPGGFVRRVQSEELPEHDTWVQVPDQDTSDRDHYILVNDPSALTVRRILRSQES